MLGNATDKAYSAENIVTAYSRRCLIEWNMNYYYGINEPSDSLYGGAEKEYYKRFFPLKDVTKGWRPPAGAFRGRLSAFKTFQLEWPNSGKRSDLSFSCNTPTNNTYTLKTRLYNAMDNSEFKYYETPYNIYDAAYVHPYIEYTSTTLFANKVVVGFQRAAAIPKNFTVQIKNTAGTWVTIGTFSNVSAVDSEGRVTLYYNGTSWSTTQPAESLLIPSNTVNIRGIKVVVTSMANSANVTLASSLSYLTIIDMSARTLLSFTDRLNSWDWDSNIAENDTILPIGSLSTNSGTVTLSNNDEALTPLPTATTASYGYFMRKYGRVQVAYKASTAGSTWVNQFTGYIDNVQANGLYDTVGLDLYDKLMFAKETKAHDLLLKGHSVTAIIYTLFDLAGIGPVIIKHAPGEAEPSLTYFYSNKEESVFDAVQELCRAHQYSISVDENDNIVVYTRNYIFSDRTDQYVFTTDNYTSGGVDYVPNITSYTSSETDIINSASVTYRPLLASSAPDPGESLIKNQVAYSRARTLDLWRPTQPILLGCTPVIRPIAIDDNTIQINRQALRNAEWGAYSGYALIDTEIIKFDGLQVAYTPKTGAPAGPFATVKSPEEFREIVSYARGAVTFTGKLMNVERGQFGTEAKAHTLALSGWTKSPAAKLAKAPNGDGFLHIRSAKNGPKSVAYAVKILDPDSNWVNTRMSIDNINTKSRGAGIIVSSTTSSSGVTGLYVEVVQGVNKKADTVAVYRVNNSIINRKPLAGPVTTSIENGKPFNLAVYFRKLDGVDRRRITVYIDGEPVLGRIINTNLAVTKKVGLAATGDTSARFFYIYGGRGAGDEQYETAVDATLKSYVSGMVKRDRSLTPYREMPNLAAIGFERFDDNIREVYVDDVRFERGPAMNVEYKLTEAKVYDKTMTKQIALGRQLGGAVWGVTPFGATVTVANISNLPVVVAYVDGGGTASNFPYIWGRIVEEFEEARYEYKDEESIFRNGEKKYEFSSRWINNSAAAKKLIDKFVVARGKTPKMVLELDVWSPHVLQIGDEVFVNIPEKDISSDFIVMGYRKSGEDVIRGSVRLVEK